jgi:protoheme ferro-lyase
MAGDAEKLRYYRAAARVARKINRTLQSRSERLETFLDRHVARKAAINYDAAMGCKPLYEAVKDQVTALEKALADMVSVAGY